MNDEQFWAIIQDCHEASGGNTDRKDQLIVAAICRLPGKEAEAFYAIFNRMMDSANTWGLWGAAYLINEGCGDDTFADFRASLISRGRSAFQNATANPDSLADEDIDPDGWFHEGFQYAVAAGVKKVLGTLPRRANPAPATPVGERWTECTVRKYFPNLTSRLTPH
jgi:hypothetical protein